MTSVCDAAPPTQVWDCFDDYSLSHPYVCSHMALFASACEDELRHASGAAALAAGSPLCARVQDGCTGGDADGDAGVGGDDDETEAYYVQFPILLEMDKCAAVLAVEGGGAFLQSYLANCSDAPLCVGELETARAACSGLVDAGNGSRGGCSDACRGAIDGLFSAGDGGASWALCQGVRAPVDLRANQVRAFDDGFDYRARRGRRAGATYGGSEWTTFGREAVTLYTTFHYDTCAPGGAGAGGGAGYAASEYAGQCTRRNGSSLLTAIVVLMVGVGAALYLVLARFDRAQPTLAAQDGAAAGGGVTRERAAVHARLLALARASIVLGSLALLSAWTCYFLPLGVVAAVVALVAGGITRSNAPLLLRGANGAADAAAGAACCGDAADPSKWLESVACMHVAVATLAAIGGLVAFLVGILFVNVGRVADGGRCFECATSGRTFCDWSSCNVGCDAGSARQGQFCQPKFCGGGGGCGGLCQLGVVTILSVLVLAALATVSVLASRHANRARAAFRERPPVVAAEVMDAVPVAEGVVPGAALAVPGMVPVAPVAVAAAYTAE